MSEQPPRAICVGEGLIELTRGADGTFAPACAGDSFNTAIYLARAGLRAGFATAVGDDPYSDSIIALALAEGLATDLILRVPGRLPAVSGRARPVRRKRDPRLGRGRGGARIVRAARLDADRPEPDNGAADLLFGDHAVALLQ